jgi:hypothetical protein
MTEDKSVQDIQAGDSPHFPLGDKATTMTLTQLVFAQILQNRIVDVSQGSFQ